MNNVFAGVGNQVYILMNQGQEDEHIVEVTLNGTTKIVHECTERFPISFTVKLPLSFPVLNAQIKSDLRKAKGRRHYIKRISTKAREKLIRKWLLRKKKYMFKRP